MGLNGARAVKLLSAYVVGGFVIMEVCYFGVWCRPFTEYWAVPTDNGKTTDLYLNPRTC